MPPMPKRLRANGHAAGVSNSPMPPIPPMAYVLRKLKSDGRGYERGRGFKKSARAALAEGESHRDHRAHLLKAVARQPDSPDAPYVTERHRNSPLQEFAIRVSKGNSTASVGDGVDGGIGGIGLASAD
jgi:hypothetical protein